MLSLQDRATTTEAGASSSKQAAAMEASSNLLRATQIAAETSPMVKRRTVSPDRKMSRDLSEERGGGSGIRRLSRDEALATTSSRRISSSSAEHQMASSSSIAATTVVTAVQQQQQQTTAMTRQAVSSAHLSAEDAGIGGVTFSKNLSINRRKKTLSTVLPRFWTLE